MFSNKIITRVSLLPKAHISISCLWLSKPSFPVPQSKPNRTVSCYYDHWVDAVTACAVSPHNQHHRPSSLRSKPPLPFPLQQRTPLRVSQKTESDWKDALLPNARWTIVRNQVSDYRHYQINCCGHFYMLELFFCLRK